MPTTKPVIKDYEKIEEQIDTAIDQLGQALCNADWHYNGVIEKDRVQDAMQTLMNISQTYVNLKKKKRTLLMPTTRGKLKLYWVRQVLVKVWT